jgi:hypothetical protein
MNLPEITIATHVDLHARIMQLTNLKDEQETQIKRDFKEIGYSIAWRHPEKCSEKVL